MALTLDQLLGSPDHYLHSFDGGDVVFVPMDRAAYRRSIFLDRRISPAAEGSMRLAVQALQAADPAPQATGWIFHVAHCGSTLLARAIDELGEGLVLREPLSLRQLALNPDPDRLKLARALLARRYGSAQPTVIKANVPVNFLIDQIGSADREASAIFLYATLSDYLHAILRSPNHRAWLRNVTQQLSAYLGDLSNLSDGEVAAALWAAQIRRYADAIKCMPNARSLDAERFFGHPADVVQAAATHFGRSADAAKIEELVAGPLFNTYSKNPEHAFDNAERLARRTAVATELAGEVAVARNWLARHAPDSSQALQTVIDAALPA